MGLPLSAPDSDMGSNRSDGSGKERLRWTQELHYRFEEAVNQLGGPDSKSAKPFPGSTSEKSATGILFSGNVFVLNPAACYLSGATPKGILKAMGVPGLTIYHVKSHLQVLFLSSYINTTRYKFLIIFLFCLLIVFLRSTGSQSIYQKSVQVSN